MYDHLPVRRSATVCCMDSFTGGENAFAIIQRTNRMVKVKWQSGACSGMASGRYMTDAQARSGESVVLLFLDVCDEFNSLQTPHPRYCPGGGRVCRLLPCATTCKRLRIPSDRLGSP